MRHLVILHLVLLLCWAALPGHSIASTEIFVSPDGNDSSPGTRAQPLKTLARARDVIKTSPATGERTVSFFPGVYEVTQEVQFLAADSGTASSPIVYRSLEPADPARFVAGRRFSRPNLRAPQSAVLARMTSIPAERRSAVYELRLQDVGIGALNPVSPREGFWDSPVNALTVLINGERKMPARFPDTGWLDIASVPSASQVVSSQSLPSYLNRPLPGVWAEGYFRHGWAYEQRPLGTIDPATRAVTFNFSPRYSSAASQRFFLSNILEALNDFGEWSVDVDSRVIHLVLPPDFREGIVTTPNRIIRTVGANHLIFRDLVLEGSSAAEVARVELGTKVSLSGVTVRNAGSIGITIKNGANHSVLGCLIENSGADGLSVWGGDRETLSPSNHLIALNYIRNSAIEMRTYNPHIQVFGVGHLIQHNTLENHPHAAIVLYDFNNVTVEYNRILNSTFETDDAGAIYFGRDITSLGNIFRYNYIDGCKNTAGVNPVGGINIGLYHDDGFHGATSHDNIITNCSYGVSIGGGQRNKLFRNIIYNAALSSLSVDQRYTPGAWSEGNHRELITKASQPPFNSATWRNAYPALGSFLARPSSEQAEARDNEFTQNVVIPPVGQKVFETMNLQHGLADVLSSLPAVAPLELRTVSEPVGTLLGSRFFMMPLGSPHENSVATPLTRIGTKHYRVPHRSGGATCSSDCGFIVRDYLYFAGNIIAGRAGFLDPQFTNPGNGDFSFPQTSPLKALGFSPHTSKLAGKDVDPFIGLQTSYEVFNGESFALSLNNPPGLTVPFTVRVASAPAWLAYDLNGKKLSGVAAGEGSYTVLLEWGYQELRRTLPITVRVIPRPPKPPGWG